MKNTSAFLLLVLALLLTQSATAQHTHAPGTKPHSHGEEKSANKSADAKMQTPFTLVSSQKKTFTEGELAGFETAQTPGTKGENNTLTFAEKTIRLVVRTGPEDDMLSYRIQGVRNPTLVLPAGAQLNILFANTDIDMRHDVRFGANKPPFEIAPPITATAGSEKLPPKGENGTSYAGEEIVIRASVNGEHVYFCSVRGHAKGGMWGNVVVGVKPGKNLQMPEKIEHVHSPDEDKEDGHSHGDNAKPHSHDEKAKPDAKKPEGHQHQDEKAGDRQPQETASTTAQHNHAGTMRSMVDLNDPMTRESSGTAWVPDSSPMYANMKMFGNQMLMFHGNMFVRYSRVGSNRDVSIAGKGDRDRFDAPSMFMAMYSRPLTDKSQIGLRAMISLDPAIERGYGYPLLYQSGETYRGRRIHDRQHPHDFLSELAATFSYKFNDKTSMFVYAGLPGEPALGPPTFMHRLSAMDNPDAPISHHWQDATHITWGVVTAGISFNKVKFEASAFRGREPDENRWNIETPKLDSFSGRISWNPTREWAFQVSHGRLKNPEPSEPELEVLRRTTASAIYNKQFTDDRNWANSFIWGQNHSEESRTNAFLFESAYQFQANTIFGRIERVEKDSHELALPHPHPEGKFWVGAYSLGYVRDLVRNKGLDVGLGAQVTFNQNPAILTPFYGGTNHQGFQFFLRFRPSKMKHE